jgi:hypothetical protein
LVFVISATLQFVIAIYIYVAVFELIKTKKWLLSIFFWRGICSSLKILCNAYPKEITAPEKIGAGILAQWKQFIEQNFGDKKIFSLKCYGGKIKSCKTKAALLRLYF